MCHRAPRWSFVKATKKQPVTESGFRKLMPLWLTGFVAARITETKVICHTATGIHLKAQRVNPSVW